MKFLGRDFEPVFDKKIVFSENGEKYEAVNPNAKPVLKIHVDGDLITSGERCDFALYVPEEKKLYLIELNGCDKAHAFEQILATINSLNGSGFVGMYFPRIIVAKDSAPNIKSAAQKRLEKLVKSHKCEVCVVKARFFSESI